MKNRIYTYFFHEFIRYFIVVLFAITAVIWTIQAVNFLDLVTDDGHAFKIYLLYTLLTLPKIITKLIPFAFLFASMLTILKLEKDNELIILWTSGLNKMNIVNLIFRISLVITLFHLFMSTLINPQSLNFARGLIKDSKLQFASSLLKERQFNDSVKDLTVFVEKKNIKGEYENIFLRDEARIISKVSTGSSTIFAKYGYVSKDKKKLVLIDGNIQKSDEDGSINIITFQKTQLDLSGLSTKTTSAPKIQETSTLQILKCVFIKNFKSRNCGKHVENISDTKIEINRRLGMPFFIPLIGLISCFLLASGRESKFNFLNKYICFAFGFLILFISEIAVRYSGLSIKYTAIYFFFPVGLLPLVYLFLIRNFKYENLH